MKRVLYCIVILVWFGSFVFGIEGVSPGSYEVSFESGLERDFDFDFVLDADGVLSVYGDLAECVSLDKDRIYGRENVVVSLRLPEEIDTPGVNVIRIVAGGVTGIINVFVPYPDYYVSAEIGALNANAGEFVDINLKMLNLGREDVVVNASVEVYRQVAGCRLQVAGVGCEGSGELIEVFEFPEWNRFGRRDSSEGLINVSSALDFKVALDTSNYSVGDYIAVGLVDYSKGVSRAENDFRLGEKVVRILSYDKVFDENEVNRFEVEVESFWDDGIREIYAEVAVGCRRQGFGVGDLELGGVGERLENGEEGCVVFDTPIVGLGAWERKTLVGFFDSNGVFDFEVDAEISLHYDGEVSSEVGEFVIIEGIDWIGWAVVFGTVVVIGFLGWRLELFVWKVRAG